MLNKFGSKNVYIALFGLLLLTCCGQNNPDETLVSGKVINGFTNEPIESASISILENGPNTKTNNNGEYEFLLDNNDLSNLEEIIREGKTGVAVSISKEGFRFKEFNIDFNEHATFELVENATPAYIYTVPVQLNDGLKVSSMSNIGVDNQIINDLI